MTMVYISNAFSLQMVQDEDLQHVRFHASDEETPDLSGVVSCVGHADTAAVLGVECARINVTLVRGDRMWVAQLTGGRLPEGSTTLPEGFRFRWILVEV
jgi:hypothetical protein